MNSKSPWSASKCYSLSFSPSQNSQQREIYAFNENRDNDISSAAEGVTPFISPSPSKFIQKKRNYLQTSDDRKGMILPELDSVKKQLHFENQSQHQGIF